MQVQIQNTMVLLDSCYIFVDNYYFRLFIALFIYSQLFRLIGLEMLFPLVFATVKLTTHSPISQHYVTPGGEPELSDKIDSSRKLM